MYMYCIVFLNFIFLFHYTRTSVVGVPYISRLPLLFLLPTSPSDRSTQRKDFSGFWLTSHLLWPPRNICTCWDPWHFASETRRLQPTKYYLISQRTPYRRPPITNQMLVCLTSDGFLEQVLVSESFDVIVQTGIHPNLFNKYNRIWETNRITI